MEGVTAYLWGLKMTFKKQRGRKPNTLKALLSEPTLSILGSGCVALACFFLFAATIVVLASFSLWATITFEAIIGLLVIHCAIKHI